MFLSATATVGFGGRLLLNVEVNKFLMIVVLLCGFDGEAGVKNLQREEEREIGVWIGK